MWTDLGWISPLNTDRAGVLYRDVYFKMYLSICTHEFFFFFQKKLESESWSCLDDIQDAFLNTM